jgi:hypothetical protein
VLYFIYKTCESAYSRRKTEVLEYIIGVEEAEKLWGLSAGYIKNLCAQGKIKSKKIGNTWVIDSRQENPSKSKKENR